MWLVVTGALAVLSSLAFFLSDKKGRSELKLGTLSLMLWGTTVLVFVDHLIPFLKEGGPFFEMATDGIVQNGVLLGALMSAPIFAVWIALVLKGKSSKNDS